MKSIQEIEILLHELKRDYLKIAFSIMQKRLISCRNVNYVETSYNLFPKLSDRIHKLAACANPDFHETSRIIYSLNNKIAGENGSRRQNRLNQKEPITTKGFVELSNYFREKNIINTELHGRLSEKLKQCTFNNIHAALRHARQGKIRAAKLHADIANSALKCAASYITKNEYTDLKIEIELKLN